MATRRQPSRIKNGSATVSNNQPSSSVSRPRSVLSRRPNNHVDSNSREDHSHPHHLEASSSTISSTQSSMKLQPVLDTLEANIKVVVRCRRRSEREIQASSPIIVSSGGPRSQEVTVEMAAPTSTLGIISLPPSKTYPFDLVFGPEADQAMIYQDVVHPMLEEVLKGYNCTLFAYGQTGTGKTHTMQGEVNLSPLGNLSSQAGMIPRALFKLFNQLEYSKADYSVKISYVELYNEELRDLLASEAVSSSQPMSLGTQKENQLALKLYDDASKKGVFIQGLEEVYVKSFVDAVALLSKGSQRRQIAATKYNDHSSRSHSVFTITVHSKEISTLGDDYLRVGKLNLVDLAGSENIGRSGAENKRAREAGMINQSLLTLGRVINALVDAASHVPYRESKLTRLLQDSLGGRTKTCIIATISPARSNLEETLSTLDYAIRAKSIRNKPEINQRMSRNALLKDYVAEIERLKADVLAAREKNGIYFSEDTWNQLSNEHELRQTEVEEARKQVEIIESQLKTVREEFEQSVALLLRTDGELKQTKEALQETSTVLAIKNQELQNAAIALEDERVIRKAHASTEIGLDRVAAGLKNVVHETTQDIKGLFSKLGRQTSVFNSNISTVLAESKNVDAEIKSFIGSINAFGNDHLQNCDELRSNTQLFQREFNESMFKFHQVTDNFIERVTRGISSMQNHGAAMDEHFAFTQKTTTDLHESVVSELAQLSTKVTEMLEANILKLQGSAIKSQDVTEDLFIKIEALFSNINKTLVFFLHSEQEAREKCYQYITETSSEEIARLNAENERLEQLLGEERIKASSARDHLISGVTALLTDFCDVRNSSLQEALEAVKQANALTATKFKAIERENEAALNSATARENSWYPSFQKTVDEGKVMIGNKRQDLSYEFKEMNSGLKRLHELTACSLRDHVEQVHGRVQKFSETCREGSERAASSKRARLAYTTSFIKDVESSGETFLHTLQSNSQLTEEHNKSALASILTLRKHTETLHTSASNHSEALFRHIEKLQNHGTQKVTPTGETPRKRIWNFVDHWELTKSREEVLRAHRELERQAYSPHTNHERLGQNEEAQKIRRNPGMDMEDTTIQYDENCLPGLLLSSHQDKSSEDIKILPLRTLSERSTNILNIHRSRSMR